MITSRSNEKVKRVVELQGSAKARREAGLFVVEGPRMAREVPAKWIEEVFVSESFLKSQAGAVDASSSQQAGDEDASSSQQPGAGFILGWAPEGKLTEVSDDVFAKMSDTKNPQGILVLARMPHYSVENLLGASQDSQANQQLQDNWQASDLGTSQQPRPILILEGIQDPGNLGTMFRSGEGAGIAGILMDETTVDVFNPKVIRSTMGSIFRVPFVNSGNFYENIKKISEADFTIYAAHLDGENYYDEDVPRKAAFMIGNEGNGLTTGVSALATKLIRIPMEGKLESLNASVAASLLVYDWHRRWS